MIQREKHTHTHTSVSPAVPSLQGTLAAVSSQSITRIEATRRACDVLKPGVYVCNVLMITHVY